ncbi:DUF6230 family protein [Corynebacterium sp. HMSC074A01]|uniref:DUF6230 family protein n=1 Tax=Corynebacterium sp. HMSC074A01 TaxID=1715030 RepID=UPI0008A19ADA|nr:DUF6230 family protein [Corynebacterium sp. HMSC074A01]OHF36584.1 cholesterol esterase [Corynebacterium sp. HMSC074A01]
MGKFNWKKTAVALTAGLAAFGATGVAVAQGGLTANLALSGTLFKVSMTHLDGEDFALFVDSEQMQEDNTIPVARLKFGHAYASNLCLSASLPDLPMVGEGTLALRANGDQSVEVRNLLVGANDIKGALQLTDANVGIDANQVTPKAAPGTWGLHSSKVSLSADDITTTSIGVEYLSASGVGVTVERGRENACGL